MMMNRAKTGPAPAAPESVPLVKPHLAASAAERVHELERRLELLPIGEAGSVPAEPLPPAAAAAAARSAPPPGNPLLKRIQAAQERARRAEQQERDAADAAAARTAAEAEAERCRAAQAAEEAARGAGARSALGDAAGRALEDKQRDILRQLEGKREAPAATRAALPPPPAPGVPIMTSLDAPPPSFQSMKFPPPRLPQPATLAPAMVGHGMNSRALTEERPPAPPSFAFVEQQQQVLLDAPPPPTAPQYVEDHLHGVQPVAPPAVLPPPPSFDAFETAHASEDEDGVFATDEHGRPLSPEQRRALMDEQRRLYESIMEDNAARSQGAATREADAFDARSANAAARALPAGDAHAARTAAMDAAGRTVPPAAGVAAGDARANEADDPVRRLVRIGPNQTAAIHGQDRTKAAIRDGTAILVQCLSCQNWMQVTDTATLMMCPVCQVVSPVVPQDQVLTKEEAIQLTMDRRMAEKLQAEAYADQDAGEGGREGAGAGFFGGLFGGGGAAPAEAGAASLASTTHEKWRKADAAPASPAAAADSWWDRMSSLVSYGVASEERGELGVTRPPGNPGYPATQRSPVSINDARVHGEETRGLLTPAMVDDDNNAAHLPAGRVAESRPLFSCVVDGMSNAASAVFSTDSREEEEGDAVLVTRAGRGVGDGVGEYARVPDERL